MFDNFKKIGERIYVLDDFLTQKEMDDICLELDNAIWTKHEFETVTPPMKESDLIMQKLKPILGEDLFKRMTIYTAFRRFLKGDTMGIHYDANYDPNLEWALIVYLKPFEGGELYYKNQDITYQGKAGQLVIHGADEFCTHQVLEVKSDVRYTYLSNISRAS
jgi:hypothetical protein